MSLSPVVLDDHNVARNHHDMGEVIEVIEVPEPEDIPVEWPVAEPAAAPEPEPVPA